MSIKVKLKAGKRRMLWEGGVYYDKQQDCPNLGKIKFNFGGGFGLLWNRN